MSEGLKPCPACGNPVRITGGDSWHNQNEFWIACKNRECGCCRVGDTVREECIERWNALPRTLTWTKEYPKIPGMYWCRVVGQTLITRVDENKKCPIEDYDAEWAGPIPEPREPHS